MGFYSICVGHYSNLKEYCQATDTRTQPVKLIKTPVASFFSQNIEGFLSATSVPPGACKSLI